MTSSVAGCRLHLLAMDIRRPPPGGGFMGRSLREPSSDSELLVEGHDGLPEILSEGIRTMKLAFLLGGQKSLSEDSTASSPRSGTRLGLCRGLRRQAGISV